MTTSEIATIIERLEGQRRDLDRIEASQRWLWRTVLTAVIGSTVAFLFTTVQGLVV